jgi:hypothetical protein
MPQRNGAPPRLNFNSRVDFKTPRQEKATNLTVAVPGITAGQEVA